MKNQFVIENVSPFFKSEKEDSKFLTGDMKDFSGINCRITFRKILDINTKTVEKELMLMNLGNTNPAVVKYLRPFINGLKTSENGKIFLDTDKLLKGAIIEMEYSIRIIGGKKHIVPIGDAKFIGYVNMDKVKKIPDKVTQLF